MRSLVCFLFQFGTSTNIYAMTYKTSEQILLFFVLFMLKDLRCSTWILECAAIWAVIDI